MSASLRPHSYPKWLQCSIFIISLPVIYFFFELPRYYMLNKQLKRVQTAMDCGDCIHAINLSKSILEQQPSCQVAKANIARAMRILSQKESQEIAQ